MSTPLVHDTVPVPGRPFGLPLLAAIRRDPLGVGHALQHRLGDVAAVEVLFRRIVYFFRPEAVRQILVDQGEHFEREARLLDIFASFQGRNALTTEGPDWERQRRLLTPAFSPKRMAGYMGLMRDAIEASLADELPAEAGQGAVVDVDFLTTRITMDVILRTLFSHATSHEEAMRVSVAIRALTRQSMREVFWAWVPPAWLPHPGRAAKQASLRVLHGLIERHIAARSARTATEAGDGDVLDRLLAARDDASAGDGAGLSAQEVHDNCVLLFAAGFDTASSALTWWLGLMATHPEVAQRVRSEVAAARAEGAGLDTLARLLFLNATIKEAMRLYSPSTALFNRVALRDVVIDGTPVPKGTLVVVPVWHLHRDARSFPEPERFLPERFLPDAPPMPRGAFLPFGAGPHFCLGQHFAMVEMALVAAHVIERFDLTLAEGDALPEPVVDLALKPKQPLRLRFTRRDIDTTQAQTGADVP
ncbi:cytochrome P450 [Silanimonas sp.]|jgi:cytochrome P450|uniref:cytochrome P450 n=1 Tax=Silanimonas sp. TaxID=1929290 RepID=UPI0037CA93B1